MKAFPLKSFVVYGMQVKIFTSLHQGMCMGYFIVKTTIFTV